MRLTQAAVTLLTLVGLVAAGASLEAQQQRFSDLVGPVAVKPVKSGALEVPFITWGGDVATFHANGGLTTKSGSIYDDLGLKMNLRAGDDFPAQVRRYLAGETPFLRGTLRMIGLASETIGRDPRTKGVVIMQMTWSAGDHLVGRDTIRTLADLKGKKIAIQRGGPHIGMLDDILGTPKIGWNEVQIVWCDELTGDNGPAALFAKDSSIDACCVITPDMIGLTGGLDSKGTGAEGTVAGAHVVVSTAQMSRSIADVYVCRKDYFDSNKETVKKFVAGYFRGCEEVVDLKKDFAVKGSASKYMDVLRMTQNIYGKDVIPTLEIDAHGLISDCTFVGISGNAFFFNEKNNPVGFGAKQKVALDLATGQGYAQVRSGLFDPGFDGDSYDQIAELGKLKYRSVASKERIKAESEDLFPDDELDDRTIMSFTIGFKPEQFDFSTDVYGQEFQRAVEQASLYGNAVIAIRGHADPSLTLINFIRAGMEKGILKRSGTRGNRKYYYNNKPLSIADTETIIGLIESGAFDGTDYDPRLTMQAALNLSRKRAEAVRDQIIAYAKEKGIPLDKSQIQPVGVGIGEPLIAKPTKETAGENRRVEFRLVKVPAEALDADDFDF